MRHSRLRCRRGSRETHELSQTNARHSLAKRAAPKTASAKRPPARPAVRGRSDALADGHQKLEAWLAETSDTEPGKALAQFLAKAPAQRALLAGIADASPYPGLPAPIA